MKLLLPFLTVAFARLTRRQADEYESYELEPIADGEYYYESSVDESFVGDDICEGLFFLVFLTRFIDNQIQIIGIYEPVKPNSMLGIVTLNQMLLLSQKTAKKPARYAGDHLMWTIKKVLSLIG